MFDSLLKQGSAFGALLLLAATAHSTLISAGSASADRAAQLTVQTANYDDAPLQIAGLKHADEAGKEPRIHLQNVSSPKTSKIWIEAEIRSLSGGKEPIRANTNYPNLEYPKERTIEPGGAVWARETVLESPSIMDFAAQLQTTCVSVRVTVLRVELADGSSWTAGIKGVGKSLRVADQSPYDVARCKTPPSGGPSMLEIAGGTLRFEHHPEKFINWEDEKAYSFSCPLILRGGKYYAACPY